MNIDFAGGKIDALHFCAVHVETLYGDAVLGPATGFFMFGEIADKPVYWLITNWHVITGRNAEEPKTILHSQLGLPNQIRLSLVLKPNQPEYDGASPGEVKIGIMTLNLYDSDGHALWFQHPRKNEIDVAVLRLPFGNERFEIFGVNQIADDNDMAVEIGSEVFILGYPLGFRHFMTTPIWKRGSIASEPHLTTDTRGRVVIDATTRGGMSGSAVVMRAKTHYLTETGLIKSKANATRWIGVYSSRPGLPSVEEDRRAEVGFFLQVRLRRRSH